MKFEILRASDTSSKAPAPCDGAFLEGNEWVIEINTLEELLALQNKVGNDLIVNNKQIWIYDDYME